MRIYSNSFELMSEMGRELNSYGQLVKTKRPIKIKSLKVMRILLLKNSFANNIA